MMHIYKYRHISPTIEYGAPREITQEGVAEVLGISRSHAALITNKLEKDGLLYSGRAKVVGQTQGGPRKVYFVTQSGRTLCDEFEKGVASGDIDAEAVSIPNNINYCSSSAFWSLPEDRRTAIGCLLVLRVPVRRFDLGDDIPPLIPFDYKGRMSIKTETKRWYIQGTDTETLKRWHSAAADWCTDHGCDPKERLYHLHRSNRRREAIRLVESIQFMLMDFPDKESRDIIGQLADESGNPGLHLITARMSLRMGDIGSARGHTCIDGLDTGIAGAAMLSEIMLAEGHKAMALDHAIENYVGDIDSAAALGMCMTANGRFEEALTYLSRCRNEIRRSGCVFRMDEVLRIQSEALRGLGHESDADRVSEAAEYWRMDPRLRFRLRVSDSI